jgi:hypothetical protein
MSLSLYLLAFSAIKVLRDGLTFGAAVLGVPMKATVKEADADGEFVLRTVCRLLSAVVVIKSTLNKLIRACQTIRRFFVVPSALSFSLTKQQQT